MGEREIIDILRVKGLSSVWDHGELERRPTKPWDLVQHGVRRRLQVYGRVGEGSGKCVQTRQKNRKVEETDKVEAAPGVTVASLRRFQAFLIGSTQGLPKAASVAPIGTPENPEKSGGHRMVRGWRCIKRLKREPLFVLRACV